VDRTVLRSLLQRLAAHANELDPVAGACDVAEDIEVAEAAAAVRD
jgi:hypothetical protein